MTCCVFLLGVVVFGGVGRCPSLGVGAAHHFYDELGDNVQLWAPSLGLSLFVWELLRISWLGCRVSFFHRLSSNKMRGCEDFGPNFSIKPGDEYQQLPALP